MEADIGDLSIRILETRHASIREVVGELVSGVPLSFLFRTDGNSVHHATTEHSRLSVYSNSRL